MRWLRCPSCGTALAEEAPACGCGADLTDELLPLQTLAGTGLPPSGLTPSGQAPSGQAPSGLTPFGQVAVAAGPPPGPRRLAGALTAVLVVALVVGARSGDRSDDQAGPPETAIEQDLDRPETATMRAVTPDQPPDTLPSGWEWRPVGPLPGRHGHVSVWTGQEVVLWGGDRPGRSPEGATWDPESDRWRRIAPAPLSNRVGPASVWTGADILVWGGLNRWGLLSDGAAYNPRTDRWRPLPPAPISERVPLVSVWTGREMLVLGAKGYGSREGITDGAAYNPSTDTWRLLPPIPVGVNEGEGIWTGTEVVLYGGYLDRNRYPTRSDDRAIGAALDPESGDWRVLPVAPLSSQAVVLARTGDELIAWDHNLRAATLDLAAERWIDLPSLPLRRASCLPAGVTAGRFVYAQHCGQAALFEPEHRSWRIVESPRGAYEAPLFTGEALVLWLGPSGRPHDGTWLRPLT